MIIHNALLMIHTQTWNLTSPPKSNICVYCNYLKYFYLTFAVLYAQKHAETFPKTLLQSQVYHRQFWAFQKKATFFQGRALTYSNHKKHNTLKCVIVVSPTGSICSSMRRTCLKTNNTTVWILENNYLWQSGFSK